jgi:plastocyanin
MRRLQVPALAVAALVALAACSSGSTSAPTTAPSGAVPSAAGASAPAGGAGAVSIKDFAFNPPTIQAKVGDMVTWTNNGGTAHTVTLDDKSVDSGNVAPGATFSHAFTKAGSYPYHCEIHKQMTATVTVTG